MIIRKNLVPSKTARKVTSGTGNSKRKICIHETDNMRAGANADAHSRLQYNGNSRKASWHWQVDDKEAVQSFTHDWRCWAAGNAKGNNEAIHIEICVNSDGNYQQAVRNAAQLVAKIIKEEKLTINDVVQHNFYSGKNCPRTMRAGNIISWSSFLQMVKESEELTVSQYNELQSQISHLKAELMSLRTLLNNKANAHSTTPIADWAKDSYEWAVREGLTDGTNPTGALIRQQGFVILKRFYDKYLNVPD